LADCHEGLEDAALLVMIFVGLQPPLFVRHKVATRSVTD
jgi:hypothetical protein